MKKSSEGLPPYRSGHVNKQTINMMKKSKLITYIGQTFNQWTVIAVNQTIRTGFGSDMRHTAASLCKCACGTIKKVSNACLFRGGSKACRQCANISMGTKKWKHGLGKTRAYRCWASMKSRCSNPKDPAFRNYGARGISVCDRWMSFENFYQDMGDPPKHRSIERINNNGNYSPDNCRWASVVAQNRNTRRNRILTYQGVTACVTELCERFHVNVDRVGCRIRRGWPVDKAFS